MRQKAKTLRRRQILGAALATFAARGYDKTTMEDIRIAADVSKGTIYLYFDTKEALFAAGIEYLFEDLLEQFQEIVAGGHVKSAADRLRAFLGALTEMFETEGERIGLYVDFYVQAWTHDSVQEVLAEAYEKYIAAVTALVQQGIDDGEFRPVNAEIVSRIVLGAVDGIMLQKLLDPAVDYQPLLAELTTMTMRSLQAGMSLAT